MSRNVHAGMDQVARSLPFTGAGKIFIVGDSDVAGYNDLVQMFGSRFKNHYATIDSAISACTASRGDYVLVMPNHTETVSTAGGIAQDVAGVSVIGLGEGNNRPVITFSATGATWAISANNCVLKNIVGTTSVDGNTNPFNVTGDNCTVDIEWQDASSAIEAATAIRLDTANNATVKLKYLGFTAGNALVSAIRLDDCDNVRIDIDGFGVCSTAWVEMVDVASTNVYVKARTFTQGVTGGTRNVVDTITGSSWYANIDDMSAGSSYSGGSGSPLAADDISTINSSVTQLRDALYDSGGIGSFPAAAAPANGVSVAEVLRDAWDVLRNGSGGAEPATNRSIMDYQGVSESFFFPGLGYRVATATPSDIFDGTSDKALFTVSGGKVLLTCIWVETSGAAIDASASNLTFSTNPTIGTDAALTTNLDINADEIGSLYSIGVVGAATTGGSGGGAAAISTPVIIDVGTICIDTSADVGTGGALGSAVMYYIPLEAGATVAAAF